MHIELKKVCVATDFSEQAAHALQYGATLAKQFGATLYLLHIVQDLGPVVAPVAGMGGVTTIDLIQGMEKEANEGLKRVAETTGLPPSSVVPAVRIGVPFHEITRYCKAEDIDLLIVGTHGRTGLKHFLLGSVAERVVRSSPCPVLTIRHPEHEFVVPD